MTGLSAFVKESCCNWIVDHCVGTDIVPNEKGTLTHFNEGSCLVIIGKRCQFFERAVLPCAVQAAATAYGQIAKKVFVQDRRQCVCGNPLPPHSRMCDLCAKKARRQTRKQAQKKWRNGKVSM